MNLLGNYSTVDNSNDKKDEFVLTFEGVEELKIDNGTFGDFRSFTGENKSTSNIGLREIAFSPERNILVGISQRSYSSARIYFWDYRTQKFLKMIDRGSYCTDIMIWDEENVVVTSTDESIVLSLTTLDVVASFKLEIFGSAFFTRKCHRISPDLYVCVGDCRHESAKGVYLAIVSFSQKKVIRCLLDGYLKVNNDVFFIDNTSTIKSSLSQDSCIFINGRKTKSFYDSVVLIDIERNKQLKTFFPKNECYIFNTDRYLNSRNEEILILVGNKGVEFHNLKTKDVVIRKTDAFDIKFLMTTKTTFCVNHYIFLMSSNKICIYDTENEKNLNTLNNIEHSVHVHEFSGYSTRILPLLVENDSVLMVAFCTGVTKTFRFKANSGISFGSRSAMEIEDLRERVEFMRSENELMYFDEEGWDWIGFNFGFESSVSFKISKIFLVC